MIQPGIGFDSWRQISQRRINIPCRSLQCTHLQCFDAPSWLALPQNACPVCDTAISIEDLVVDMYFDDILKHTQGEVEEVFLEVDGTWRIIGGEFDPSGWLAPAITRNNYPRTNPWSSARYSDQGNNAGCGATPPGIDPNLDEEIGIALPPISAGHNQGRQAIYELLAYEHDNEGSGHTQPVIDQGNNERLGAGLPAVDDGYFNQGDGTAPPRRRLSQLSIDERQNEVNMRTSDQADTQAHQSTCIDSKR
ncbi:SUMO ligase siz1, partial [Ceratobasidium sp. UAMH 11750]